MVTDVKERRQHFEVNHLEQFTFSLKNGINGVTDLRGSGLSQV